MTQLLSFHNDKKIKETYVARLKAHHKADEFIRGSYWRNGKGCAVGCTIHGSEHKRYETELGIPEWLARLEDRIFEGLPNGEAKDFARDFLQAIPIGVSLEKIRFKFAVILCEENITRVEKLKISNELKKQVLDAIKEVKKLNQEAIKTGKLNKSAAGSAAASAALAAGLAASAALAELAASAELAGLAALAAALAELAASAELAAASAGLAGLAAYIRYSEILLDLLRKAR